MRHYSNFLKAWTDLFANTEVPSNFAVWTGIWLVSSVLRDRVYLPWGARNIYPNLYVMLIGPSGGGKSYSSGLAIDRLKDLTLIDLYEGGHTKPELLDYLATLAQMQTAHHAKPKGLGAHLAFYSDEFAMSVPEGQQGIEFLKAMTLLYDTGYSHGTRKSSIVSIDRPIISWLALSTVSWLEQALPANLVASGFVSRFIAVKEPLSHTITPVPPKIDQSDLARLTADLFSIAMLEQEYVVTEEALEQYEYWYTGARTERLAIGDEIYVNILGREWEQALKVSMILTACCSDKTEITTAFLDSACKLAMNARMSSLETFRTIATGDRESNIQEYLYQKIQSEGLISHSLLLRNSSRVVRGAKMFNEVIDSLLEEESIERVRIQGGRWYKIKQQSSGGATP